MSRWNIKKELDGIKKVLSHSFASVREEFDEHLTTINANTTEIDHLREILSELDGKVQRLQDRVDDIHMSLNKADYDFNITEPIRLSLREQEIFQTLYALEVPCTIESLSHRTSLPTSMILNIIERLVSKQIPIIKSQSNNEVTYAIDPHFKEYQARNNVLQISKEVSQQVTLQAYTSDSLLG